MSRHKNKYYTKLLLGFCVSIIAIMFIMFASFERAQHDHWYFWGIIASFLFCWGIYLVGSAFVHKTKSDLVRRQKSRQLSMPEVLDEE